MAPCNDKASQSNPEEVAARHLSLLMDVDFDTQVIQATAEYSVEIMVRSSLDTDTGPCYVLRSTSTALSFGSLLWSVAPRPGHRTPMLTGAVARVWLVYLAAADSASTCGAGAIVRIHGLL